MMVKMQLCLSMLLLMMMLLPSSTYSYISSTQLLSSLYKRHANRTISKSNTDSNTNISACASKTCKNCKKQFKNDDNVACVFHPGIYTGRLNRINDVDTSDLEFFWSCCGEYSISSTGCISTGKHYSYDDADVPSYSVFTGKRIKY